MCVSVFYSWLEVFFMMEYKFLILYGRVEQVGNMFVIVINCLVCKEGFGVLLLFYYFIVLIYDYNDYYYYVMWQNVVVCGKWQYIM